MTAIFRTSYVLLSFFIICLFDGDFIRHLPRPLLQHHIDEVPRARRLVSVDGNSLSKRRNIIRELGQRNPKYGPPDDDVILVVSRQLVGCDRTLFPFPILEILATSDATPCLPYSSPFLCLLERDGLYNTPSLDSMQQMASHQPSHVLKPPPLSPSETGHLLHQRDATDVSRGAATKKVDATRPRTINRHNTHHLGVVVSSRSERAMGHQVCLQLKNQQATWKQATQLNHHIRQNNVSLDLLSPFQLVQSPRPNAHRYHRVRHTPSWVGQLDIACSRIIRIPRGR